MINVVLAKWLAFSYIPSNWTCPKKEREKRKEKGLRYPVRTFKVVGGRNLF